MQVLGAGALKPLAEHMNGQQFTWLQGLISAKSAEARAAEAAALAGFLAGCSQQGFKYSPAYYGCLVPYMPVCASSSNLKFEQVQRQYFSPTLTKTMCLAAGSSH